jgi:hypothetical protein
VGSSSLLVWALITVVGFTISACERRLIEQLYTPPTLEVQPPTQADAVARFAAHQLLYPDQANTALPLLYAYSGLNVDEIAKRFVQLGASRSVTRAGRTALTVMVALLYPFIPAPDVKPLEMKGFIGCIYVNLYGFFRLTQENLMLAIVAAVVLLAVSPLAVQSAYLRFMREHRIPAKVQAEVIRREWGFAFRMIIYTMLSTIVNVLAVILLLLLSALTATWLDSPLAGVVVLVIPSALAASFLRLFSRANPPRMELGKKAK